MTDTAGDLLKVGAAAIFILANAFFVAAEFALVSVRRTRIEELVAQGNNTARVVKRLISDPDRFIAATQLGITIASLALGWVGEPAVAHLFELLFGDLPAPLISPAAQAAAATLIAFSLITFLHVVVGELAPKSAALANPESTAFIVSRPMLFFETIFRPAIIVLNGAGNWLLRVLGIKQPPAHQMVHSVEELKMLVTASTVSGELEPVEQEMAQRAFDFADRQVVEVMIPRPAIRAVEDTENVQDFLNLFSEVSHSRFPVYSGNIDNIIGFIWVKDILRALARNIDARTQKVKSLTRNALFVPASKPIGQLFSEMQRQKIQLAIVLDEYGGTAGMVTIEELIEEVVGRVSDELTTGTPPYRRVEGGAIEADARLRVDEVNTHLGLDLPESDDYETLAGLVMTSLGRVPKEGDTFRVGGTKLVVEKMQGPRIERIIVTRAQEKK